MDILEGGKQYFAKNRIIIGLNNFYIMILLGLYMLLYKKIKVVSITFSALPEQFSTGNIIFKDVDLAFTIFRIALPVLYGSSFVRKRLKNEE